MFNYVTHQSCWRMYLHKVIEYVLEVNVPRLLSVLIQFINVMNVVKSTLGCDVYSKNFEFYRQKNIKHHSYNEMTLFYVLQICSLHYEWIWISSYSKNILLIRKKIQFWFLTIQVKINFWDFPHLFQQINYRIKKKNARLEKHR